MRACGIVKVININTITEPWLTEVAGQVGFDVVCFDMDIGRTAMR